MEPIYSFGPICDESSRILILGTMASPASLRAGMYYSHPQNAFWRILHDLTDDEPGSSNDEKRAFLLRNGIAVWDTLRMCTREGASDSAIRNTQPNDVADLVSRYPQISAVFLNGSAAFAFYKKFHAKDISRPFFRLPSTSPANARGGYVKKFEAWHGIVSEYLNGTH